MSSSMTRRSGDKIREEGDADKEKSEKSEGVRVISGRAINALFSLKTWRTVLFETIEKALDHDRSRREATIYFVVVGADSFEFTAQQQ